MIPASYLYKDVFTQTWGDPTTMQAEPIESEPKGPRKGRLVGLAGLLAAVLTLETERQRPGRVHA